MLKTDCIYFNYEEDMGKSIPYCKVEKHKCTPCMCNMEINYIDNCDNCNRYVRKDYSFLESVICGYRTYGEDEGLSVVKETEK